jgi:ATP-dependent Clp protease adaptor protein ClpS
MTQRDSSSSASLWTRSLGTAGTSASDVRSLVLRSTCHDEQVAAEVSAGPKPPGPPPPPKGPVPDGDNETGVDVREKPKTHVPRRYKVLFHNDDYTTMEFVVDALTRFFHKSQAEATHIMLTVHKKGSGVAGIYTRDVAETKVEEVMKHARESGMPLLVTAEPE